VEELQIPPVWGCREPLTVGLSVCGYSFMSYCSSIERLYLVASASCWKRFFWSSQDISRCYDNVTYCDTSAQQDHLVRYQPRPPQCFADSSERQPGLINPTGCCGIVSSREPGLHSRMKHCGLAFMAGSGVSIVDYLLSLSGKHAVTRRSGTPLIFFAYLRSGVVTAHCCHLSWGAEESGPAAVRRRWGVE
jgi:hypothetical protein